MPIPEDVHDQPHLTPEAAFIQGQKAFRRGEPLGHNPHNHSDLRPRWSDGWKEEQALHQQRNHEES